MVYVQYRTTTSESVIRTAKVDFSDSELTKCTGTHDAWFNCHIQICRFEYFGGVCLENVIDRAEFSMFDSLSLSIYKITCDWRRYITDRDLFVWFMPRPMILLECTNMQPTGVSPDSKAVRA